MIIETARLKLRPFEDADLEAYAAIRGKASVARFLPGGSAGAPDAAARVLASGSPWTGAAWVDGGFAPWAVIEKSSARLIGHLGLRHLPEIGETELLYLLDEPWWGQGLVTEGGRGAVAFAQERLLLDHLVAFAVAENHASIAVMRKLGFRPDGEQAIFGLRALRYVLTFTAPG